MPVLWYWNIGFPSISFKVCNTEDQLLVTAPQQIPSQGCNHWLVLAGVLSQTVGSVDNNT